MDVETSLLMVVLVVVELHLVVVEVEQVLVDGLVVEVEEVVPLVLFVVVSFLYLPVEEAEAVEVLTVEEDMVETLLIPGSHTMEQPFTSLMVDKVETALPMVEEAEAVVVDQVDLSPVVLLDLIKIEAVEEAVEETPTIDLIK